MGVILDRLVEARNAELEARIADLRVLSAEQAKNDLVDALVTAQGELNVAQDKVNEIEAEIAAANPVVESTQEEVQVEG